MFPAFLYFDAYLNILEKQEGSVEFCLFLLLFLFLFLAAFFFFFFSSLLLCLHFLLLHFLTFRFLVLFPSLFRPFLLSLHLPLLQEHFPVHFFSIQTFTFTLSIISFSAHIFLSSFFPTFLTLACLLTSFSSSIFFVVFPFPFSPLSSFFHLIFFFLLHFLSLFFHFL